MTPGEIRSEMEKIQARIVSLENDLLGPVSKGVVALRGVTHELAEASEGVGRAIDILDENYKAMI